jgi:hypothetical protein
VVIKSQLSALGNTVGIVAKKFFHVWGLPVVSIATDLFFAHILHTAERMLRKLGLHAEA